MEALKMLVMDTLYFRNQNEPTSCFVVNEAGIELVKCDQDVLPVIESILSDIVEPALKNHDKQKDIELAQQLRVDVKFVSTSPFRGLTNLLGIYWIISIKSNQLKKALHFMNTRSDELLAKAIVIIPIYFKIIDGDYNFGVEPPTSLIDFVKKQLNHDSAHVRQAATRALPRIELPSHE